MVANFYPYEYRYTSFIAPSLLPRVNRVLSTPATCIRPSHGRQTLRATLSPQQQTAVIAISAPAIPLVAWSELTLLTTGCGLPPGPGGALGAAEGIAYLVIAGVVALSLKEKISTGSGLPAGPGGLLGAVEGFAFLLVLAGLGDAAYVFAKYGSVPEAVPSDASRCFPSA